MIDSISTFLDWFGICVFSLTGALIASRKQMDIVGFALLGCVTGIGGGTVRDVLLGATPVFWVQKPFYLVSCIAVACAAFFCIHFVRSRLRLLLWLDAVGLALFSVTGTDFALGQGAGNTVAITMGVATATFGGVMRDVLGNEVPVILHREIYATAALVGAGTYVTSHALGLQNELALVAGFVAALTLRLTAIRRGLSLPIFKPVKENHDM